MTAKVIKIKSEEIADENGVYQQFIERYSDYCAFGNNQQFTSIIRGKGILFNTQTHSNVLQIWGDKATFVNNIKVGNNVEAKLIDLTHAGRGTCYMGTGNGDDASHDTVNVQIKTWYGFGVANSSTIGGVGTGKNAFWVNARTGDANVFRNLLVGGEITAYSDIRLKSEIKQLQNRGYIEPKTYIKDGKESIGIIAQEVKELYPALVTGDEEKEMVSVN